MKWKYCFKLTLLLALFSLVGCGFFEDNDEDSPAQPATLGVGGAGVKGPLVGADVNLYLADLSASDLKGALQGSGTTGTDAAIQDLEVPADIAGLVLLEFAVVAGTTDLTTGAAPIFSNLITLVDAQRLIDGDDIYASVLTTMVVNLARRKADSGAPYSGDGNGTISDAEMVAALAVAQNQVKSTLGFGLDSTTDIFTTPPLVTNATTTPEQQAQVAAYRLAIEGVAAIANAVSESGGGATAQDAFDGLTEDLSDGTIDGQSDSGAVEAFASVTATLQATVTQDVSTLVIPGTTTTVGSITTVLASEASTTGTTTSTTELASGGVTVTSRPAQVAVDSDGDGVPDGQDAFPNDPEETADTDEDGVGDNADAFPEDPLETIDTDEDGVGDNADAFPEDATETTDTDGDEVGDNADAFPENAEETTDTDGDGLGDNSDPFPTVSTQDDEDNDGVPDTTDNCVTVANADQADTDENGAGDACDAPAGVPAAVWNEFEWDDGATWQ